MVSFKAKEKDQNIFMTMPTTSLSPAERLALQAGAVMQVYVTRIEGDDVQVSLKPPTRNEKPIEKEIEFGESFSGPQSSIPSRSKSYIGKESSGSAKDLTRKKDIKSSKSSTKPSGVFLNDLKAGIKLEGTITHCTQYAAFVTANVYRVSKGGGFTEVTGLLHQDDMQGLKSKAVNDGGKKTYAFEQQDSPLVISRGKKIDVYVKEVWKNSGRFTLSTDPTVNKFKIIEAKVNYKSIRVSLVLISYDL